GSRDQRPWHGDTSFTWRRDSVAAWASAHSYMTNSEVWRHSMRIRTAATSALAGALIVMLAMERPLYAQNAARPAAAPKVPMADDVFKNVQVLKGISVAEFLDTMGFFAAAVGSNCVHCHVDESLTRW